MHDLTDHGGHARAWGFLVAAAKPQTHGEQQSTLPANTLQARPLLSGLFEACRIIYVWMEEGLGPQCSQDPLRKFNPLL